MTRGQHEELVSLYENDPIGFIEDIIHFEIRPDEKGRGGKIIKVGEQQKEILKGIIEALEEKKSFSCKSGRGTGKTCCFAWVGLWFAFTRPNSLVACTAPTEKQIKLGIWEEFKRWIDVSPILPEFYEWTKEVISVKNFNEPGTQGKWQIEIRTSYKQENVSGGHGVNGTLFIVDEAAGITDDKVWDGIEGCTTDKGSLLVMIGNPSTLYTRFHKSFFDNKEFYINRTLSCEHPDYRGDKDLIEKWRKMYGRLSNSYRVNVLGEFPMSDPDTYISQDEVEQSFNKEIDRNLSLPIIAIDPSDSGDDETEIVVGVGYKIHFWKTIYGKQNGLDILSKVTNIVIQLRLNCEELGFSRDTQIQVILDSNGIGASTRDLLKLKEYDLGIKLIENKANWSGDEFHEQMKDLLWGKMKEFLPKISIRISPERNSIDNMLETSEFRNQLFEQICSRRAKPHQQTGRIVLETKDQLKQRGLRSPNKGDALSLYCYLLYTKVKKSSGISLVKRIRSNPIGNLLG